jgi:hypothetical protein
VNTPIPSLMRAYGTDDVFMAKTAGALPLASRVADLAWGRSLLSSQERAREARQTAQAEMLNTAFRVLELARMEHTIDNAGHTPAQMLLPAGFDMPVGMTEGMVRLASAAGEDLAKAASEGPYRTQPPENMSPAGDLSAKPSFMARAGINTLPKLKRTALGLGGTALAVGGTLAAAKKVKDWASGAPHTPTYNTGGYQLATDTNEYGQTQGRLPTYR